MATAPTIEQSAERPELTASQLGTLVDLSTIVGADVWDRPDASDCRALEKHGLVRIVRAKNAPKDGAQRQPYFGVKISAAGRRFVAQQVSA